MSAPVRVLGAERVTARYRAPAEDGELLAEPPLAEIADQLDANTTRLAASRIAIAGHPLAEFRRRAAEEVLAAAQRYLSETGEPAPSLYPRLLVTGHQPDLFHAGVWAKNFVLNGLAGRHGATPLKFVVDNDIVKSTAIDVPVVSDDPAKVVVAHVPFDGPAGERPSEEYRVTDRGLFDSLPDRLTAYVRDWGFEPLLIGRWPEVRTHLDQGAPLGEAFARVRRATERRWGVVNLELPVSRLCETAAFSGLAHSVLSDLPRFADSYNAAIRAYRARNRLRSRHHPAPELARRGDAFEAPLWVWRTESPQREKVFARRLDGHLELTTGKQPLARLPIEPAAFANGWRGLLSEGWKVRPRALAFTLFVRLCLADGFIHGIGGGKYDEVTDDLVRRFFAIEPPAYAVVSATLRLPLPRFPATESDLRDTRRRLRDLEWNPQRFATTRSRFPELVAEKAQAVRPEPVGNSHRRLWFRRLQWITREMRPAVESELSGARARLDRITAELAANQILMSREYAWPLFPEAALRDYFTRLLR